MTRRENLPNINEHREEEEEEDHETGGTPGARDGPGQGQGAGLRLSGRGNVGDRACSR